MWAANQNDTMFSLNELMQKYDTSVGRNTNMLLGVVVDNRGIVPEPDMKRLEEFGNAIKERYGSPVKSASGQGDEISIKLDKPAVIDRVIIQEDITKGERVLEFSIRGKTEGNTGTAWKDLDSGTNIGHKHISNFKAAKVEEIKLVVTKSKAGAYIKNFSVFAEEPV
jgi:alpha-L-fucosidase